VKNENKRYSSDQYAEIHSNEKLIEKENLINANFKAVRGISLGIEKWQI